MRDDDDHGDASLAAEPDISEMALPIGIAQEVETYSLDYEVADKYIELWFPQEMSKGILDEGSLRPTPGNT